MPSTVDAGDFEAVVEGEVDDEDEEQADNASAPDTMTPTATPTILRVAFMRPRLQVLEWTFEQ